MPKRSFEATFVAGRVFDWTEEADGIHVDVVLDNPKGHADIRLDQPVMIVTAASPIEEQDPT